MRVPVQIISFSCFLFSVTVVRGQDIRCEVPRDHHVHKPEHYFRGDMTLGVTKSYYCFDGYEYTAAVAKCTRDGWTPKPLCDRRLCTPPNIPNAEILGDQRPNYKMYSRIQYKCHRGFEPEQPVEITCNSQTEWTGIRECTGTTCAAPNIPNAEILGAQRQNYYVNSRIQYKCHRGFEPEQPVEITCNYQTEWTGIQQCTEKEKLCPDLSVENGLIHTLSSNEKEIFYTCNTGYKPFSGSWWDSVTCSKGSWSEEPRCIREDECGAFPSVHHGKLKQTKPIFRDGDTTALECDPGFKPTQRLIKCVSGTWETPVCEVDVHCGFPPKVENALITSKPEEFYGDGSSVTYACRSSFLMNGKSRVFCNSGTWEETPTCKEPTCPLNTAVEDLIMKRFPDIEGPIKPGHKLIFSCSGQGLKLKGQREITCQSNEEWSSPFPECEEVMCVANLTVNMRADGHSGREVSIRPGHTITLSCVGRESKLEGRSKISCSSTGEWNVPFPKCVGGKCGPPPDVKFADTIEMTKTEYDSGDRVEYSCFNMFTLVQRHSYSKYLTCDQGEWRGSIKCLEPCSVSVELMDERGIQLRWGGRQKIFSPHGDRITFSCQRGKYSTGIDLIQTCDDGEMTLPLCE